MLVLMQSVLFLLTRMGSKADQKTDQPSELPHQFLKQITKDFNEELMVGSGSFGKVYKV
jgi:hypothetical protein